jgi:hypothetical protein
MLKWMVEEKHIEPHVPVWDHTGRKADLLSAAEFEWNKAANEYRCPEGHALRSDWRPFKSPRDHISKADTPKAVDPERLVRRAVIPRTFAPR